MQLVWWDRMDDANAYAGNVFCLEMIDGTMQKNNYGIKNYKK